MHPRLGWVGVNLVDVHFVGRSYMAGLFGRRGRYRRYASLHSLRKGRRRRCGGFRGIPSCRFGIGYAFYDPLDRDAVVFLDKLLLRYDVLDRYFHTEGIACFRWRRKFPLLPVYDSPILLREVLFPDHLSLDAAAGKLLDRFLHLGSSFGGKILQLLAFLARRGFGWRLVAAHQRVETATETASSVLSHAVSLP